MGYRGRRDRPHKLKPVQIRRAGGARGGLAERGFPSAEETGIAKAYCNQAGFEVAGEALRVMGGLGCSQDELEYSLHGCMIASGSIEILKNRIAEAVFERAFRSEDRFRPIVLKNSKSQARQNSAGYRGNHKI